MTPEKLKKVEELYHVILDVLPANRDQFLQDYCGEDTELREEIESLLSFETPSDKLIDSSPESIIKEVFSFQPNSTIIGKQINQYKIISLLGEGGMGTVFLAQDTKLERKVAIKFLTDKFVREINSLNRFFLEAKASSALNHPNIITIHEIGEFDSRPFIANEFIDGITLKEYLKKEGSTLIEILDIAIQIASALVSAHKAGIIHRDIKPENVMIRRDSIVKVLDFGLAKLSQNIAENDIVPNNLTKVSTIHGVVLGTPQFMSPEQARGKKVDTRTDIWSFGVLLYQVLTHKLPFQGETTSDIIASILKSEPPPLTQFIPYISPKLENIVNKSLKKNKDERYQTIDELLTELKNFRREVEFENKTEPLNLRLSNGVEYEKITDAKYTQITAEESVAKPIKINTAVSLPIISRVRAFPVYLSFILVSIFSVFAVSGVVFFNQSSTSSQSDAFQKMKLTKLTYDGTATNIVAASPDGKYIVYVLRNEEKEALMLRQISTSSVIQLVSPANLTYSGITFSNDGNYVYYTIFNDGVGTLFNIPTIGGNPRKIANDVDGKITFSPDGQMMAFVRSRTSLIIADTKNGSERFLKTSNQGEFWVLSEWNPNGKSILTSVFSTVGSKFYLTEVDVEAGNVKIASNLRWLAINGLVWLSDGSGIILSGRDTETKFSQLWYISYPDDKPHRITNDFNTYVGLSLTADKKSLVSIKQERLYNIWISPDGKQNSLKKITTEEGKDDGTSGIVWTPDERIVYTTRILNNVDIWIVNADGSENRQLTFDSKSNFHPAVSPDGKHIIFTSTRSGTLNLWQIEIDGSNSTAITNTADRDDFASFTPDGKSIIFRRTNSKNLNTIWKLNLQDKSTVRLTDAESSRPIVSPNGKYLACEYGKDTLEKSAKLSIVPIEGGKIPSSYDLPQVLKSKVFQWSSDGKSLVYVNKQDRINNLWNQPIENGQAKQLTFFESGQIERFAIAPDGKSFAFSRGTESSDVVMFDNFR
jgi:eukaryotic-like serine/threonine-protein kinase